MKRIEILAIIEKKIKIVEQEGFGEVIIKIKDGKICFVKYIVDNPLPNKEY